MSTSRWYSAGIALVGLALSAIANAQVSQREPGWEVGGDLIYQDSAEFDFTGGSRLNLDSEFGLSITFGYRFNPRLEAQFALDWTNVDYQARLVRDTGAISTGTGSMEAFTPRLNLNLNIIDGPFTPFVMGGVGYAFIDTNIPSGRPSTGCWWDPWYGYICTTVQATKTTDEFVYQFGLGARWDYSETSSFRFAYERHWMDISTASGTPYVDQVKLGFVYRY